MIENVNLEEQHRDYLQSFQPVSPVFELISVESVSNLYMELSIVSVVFKCIPKDCVWERRIHYSL